MIPPVCIPASRKDLEIWASLFIVEQDYLLRFAQPRTRSTQLRAGCVRGYTSYDFSSASISCLVRSRISRILAILAAS